ncbi:hypothetical protein OAH73_03270 [Planktomarina sp.]|nr:hypothetical protein [Planktomarina sp.]MDB4841585.1 hypothetical protein [Planktomarina sp.]
MQNRQPLERIKQNIDDHFRLQRLRSSGNQEATFLGKFRRRKTVITATLAFVLGGRAVYNYLDKDAQSTPYATMYEMLHATSGAAAQGRMQGHMHDEMTMPGLVGTDTTETVIDDLRTIFQQHIEIERRVTNLPNGISTVTASENPTVRAAIVSHVSNMVTRLAEGRNPEVMIQSPTLYALFEFHKEIETEIQVTDTGIDVVQTSSNPEVVKLLQAHVTKVSDMSERDMAAVHERMSQ